MTPCPTVDLVWSSYTTAINAGLLDQELLNQGLMTKAHLKQHFSG